MGRQNKRMIGIEGLIVTLIYTASLTNVQGTDSFSNIHKWPDTQIFVYSPFIDSNSVTWAACDRSESWNTNPRCSVMREIYHLNGSGNTLSCDVNLAPKDEHAGLYDNFKVVLFGKDRAILVSARKVKGLSKGAIVQLSAVHFPSCNVVQNDILYTDEFSSYGLLNFDLLDHLITITAYDDKYDVTYKNKTLCGNKLCSLSIDVAGKIVTEPHTLSVNDFGEASTLGSLPVSSNLASAGHVLTQREEYFRKENQVTLMVPSGEKILKNVKRSSDGSWISMTHSMIGFCDLIQLPNFDNSYFCAQYDQGGNLKKEMNFDLKSLKVIRSLHNLAEGGFLVLNSEDQIVKIDSEGIIIPSAFKIQGFSCEKGLSFKDAFIFEKYDREVCASRACSSHLTPREIKFPEVPTLDFAVECFPYDTLNEAFSNVETR